MSERQKPLLVIGGVGLVVAAAGIAAGSGFMSPDQNVASAVATSTSVKPENTATIAVAPSFTATLVPWTPTAIAETPTVPAILKATETATNVPPSPTVETTATPTVAPTVAPTRISEKYRLGDYNVWTGTIDGGGTVMIATLPDGRVIFRSFKNNVTCSQPNYLLYSFILVGDYSKPDSFDFARSTKQITGSIQGTTISGQIIEKGYSGSSPSGPFTCPAGQVRYTTQYFAQGLDGVIAGYRKIATGLNAFPAGTTDAQVRTSLERAIKFTLP